MPDNAPEFPVIDGEERYVRLRLDRDGEIIGSEFVPVPKDPHERLIAKVAHRRLLDMLTRPLFGRGGRGGGGAGEEGL